LQGCELTVADVVRVTELPQSRVSTHLGKLREAGVLRDRRVGVQTYYALNDGAMPDSARKVWDLLEGQLRDDVLEGDRRRAEQLLRARDAEAPWPDRVAGQMERHYSPGRTWDSTLRGLVRLLRLGDVLDAGSGDGVIAELVAPRARSVTCLDRSPRVLEAARTRLGHHPHLCFVEGDLEKLELSDTSFDEVLCFHALTYVAAPLRAVRELARVLRPGGDLVLATLDRHTHMDVASTYHHVQPGFSPRQLRGWFTEAGLVVELCEVTSRERQSPYFEVVTVHARKP
jgi:ArsR family transcriptional regulator